MQRYPRTLAGPMHALLTLLMLVLVSLSLSAHAAVGDPVMYVYDELGRLVGVTDGSGAGAAYTYDADGNILAITRTAAGQLAITEFSPNGGAPDTNVVISGSGFSATVSENVVKINNLAATVLSASTTQLVARVPRDATTGPINVTTPAGSVTSRSSFLVSASLPPAISGFTPPIGVVGAPVSITGTNFGTDKFANNLTFNGQPSIPSAATATGITTILPARSSSGKIGIATANGSALSSADFYVAPPPFTAADIQLTGRLLVGQSKTVGIAVAGKKGLILFDGVAGQRIGVALSASTLPDGSISILKPDGTTLTERSLATVTRFIDAMTLPSTGTYTLFVNPSANSSGSLTITLSAISDVTGTVTIGGPAVMATTTVPGQNANLTFSGTAGQRVSMQISGVALTDAGYADVAIINPDGTTLNSFTSISSSGKFVDAQALPATGIYTIRLDPQRTAVGRMTAQVFNVGPDVMTTATISGPAVTVATTVPGQNAAMTFSAKAGQRVSVQVSGVALTGGSYVQLTMVKPDGTTLSLVPHIASSGSLLDAQVLPDAGTYTIRLNPQGTALGTMTVQIFNVGQDVMANLVVGGPAATVATIVPGQNAALTFSATAGQRVTAQISGVALTGGSYMDLTIVKPDGTILSSAAYISSSGHLVDVPVLSAAGTYTIRLNPRGTAVGRMTVQVFDVGPDVTASVVIGGPAAALATTVPGQNAALTFSATAGQRVNISFSNVALSVNGLVYQTLLSPDKTPLTRSSFRRSGVVIGPHTLPVTGTYTIALDPYQATTGSVTVNVSPATP